MTDYESLLIEQLLAEQRAMATDIVTIKETLAERRGERRMAIWLAGGAGSVATLILSTTLEFIKARLGF